MALTTLPDDEKQKDPLDPGQKHYDQAFDDIANDERKGTFDNIADNYDESADPSQENSNIKKLQSDESQGDKVASNNSDADNIKSTYTGSNQKGKKNTTGSFWRRKGPIAAIISLVFGAGIGFSALFSPGLLIVQMKEVMVDKFNTSIASSDVRSSKVLNVKIQNNTNGVCLGKLTIACRFSTMSEKQVANFKAAGIEVEGDNTIVGNRTKPSAYNFTDSKGTTHRITAGDFESLSKKNSEFRTALKKGYDPKYGTTTGSAWTKLAKFMGLSKTDPKPAANDSEREKNLNEETKNGMKSGRATASDFLSDDPRSPCDQECAEDKAAKANQIADATDTEPNTRSKTGNTALEAASDILDGTTGTGALTSGLANSLKITGVADYACQAYGAIQAVGYAAKTVRALQLARYAMAFMKTADMIKAGTAKPEDVAYMGGILTEVTYDATSAVKRTYGSATDSFGYKYAAFGDTSASPKSMTLAGQFLAGGGLTGELINMSDTVTNALGGRKEARDVCAVLGNPWVGAGSAIVGLAFMLIPGVGQVGSAAKLLGQAALGVSVQVGLAILPNLLKDIVAGTVTESIAGEASGNAWTSGSGKMLSDSLASFNGNALMSKEDALAYNGLQNETLAQYAEDDSKTLSPFDATNRNTFLGSIVFQLLPQAASLSSPTRLAGSFGSLLTGTFAKLIPTSGALTTQQYEDSLNMCQDADYQDLEIATDPFCNVIRGLPQRYLDKDPLAVINELVTKGELDEYTGEPKGAYATFANDCITNENTPGFTDGGFQEDTGKKCIINDDNANYYLYWVDRRVNAGMSEEDDTVAASSGIDGDARSLAKQILDSGNVTEATYDSDDGSGPRELAQLQMMADGTATGNCLSDTRILKVIAGLAQKHKLVISDLGRQCNGSSLSPGGSTHWESPNVAVDFDKIDGNGNPDSDIALINEALTYVDPGQTINVGQINSSGRGGGNLTVPAGVNIREFVDGAGHLHLNF